MVVRTLFRWDCHLVTNKRERVRQESSADPHLVEAVVDAVHEQVPAYTALGGSRFPEVRAIAARPTDRLLDHSRGLQDPWQRPTPDIARTIVLGARTSHLRPHSSASSS